VFTAFLNPDVEKKYTFRFPKALKLRKSTRKELLLFV